MLNKKFHMLHISTYFLKRYEIAYHIEINIKEPLTAFKQPFVYGENTTDERSTQRCLSKIK